jgi:FkbM family methyltransferase
MLSDLLRANAGVRIVRGRYGMIAYWDADLVIGASVAAYGEWFESEVEVFRAYCGPGDTVVDVGANIGTHTMALASIVGSRGQVVSIEPQRPMHMLVCANAVMNGYLQVEPHRVAAGARTNTMRCGVPNYRKPSSFGGYDMRGSAAAAANADIAETIRIVPLDSLLHESLSLRLIKIDVEGSERDVVTGAARIIARRRPVLYIENDRIEHSRDLIQTIRALGYRLYWHIPAFFNPKNFAGRTDNIHPVGMFRVEGRLWVNGVSLNLLCIAAERDLPVPSDAIEVGDDHEHPCHERDRARLAPHLAILN